MKKLLFTAEGKQKPLSEGPFNRTTTGEVLSMKFNKTNLVIPIILALSTNIAMAEHEGENILEHLLDDRVTNNTTDIGVNTAATSKNAADIGTNAGAIATEISDRQNEDLKLNGLIGNEVKNRASEDSFLNGRIDEHDGRLTTAEGTLEDITDGSRGTGKIAVTRAEIGNALIGSAQFSPTGNIHINGRQTENDDGTYTVDTQVNINKMHVNFNGGKDGGFTSQGAYANIVARDIPTNGYPPQALEEGTGVFVRKEILTLQSISKENGQKTQIALEDDKVIISHQEGDGIAASSALNNKSANLFYTSDGWESYSAISAKDKSASMQVTVTAADGGITYNGVTVSDEAVSTTGGTTTMLLDDLGMTLSGADGADVQVIGVKDGTEGNHAINLSQFQEVVGKWRDIPNPEFGAEILDPDWQPDVTNPEFGKQILDPDWPSDVTNPDFGKLTFPNPNHDHTDPSSPAFIADPRATIPNPVPQGNVLEFPDALATIPNPVEQGYVADPEVPEFIPSDRTTSVRAAIEGTEDHVGKWKDISNPEFGVEIVNPEFGAEILDPDWQPDVTNPEFGKQILDPDWPSDVTNPDFGKLTFPNPNHDHTDPSSPAFIADPRATIPNPVPQGNVLEFPDALATIPNPVEQGYVLEFPDAPEFVLKTPDAPEFILSDRTDTLSEAVENNEGLIQLNATDIGTNTGAITSLQAEDTALNGRIDDEATARIAGDDALGIRVDDEATARIAGDDALGIRVDDEATARIAEDTAINVRVDTNVTDIGVNRTRITTNTGNIAANHSRILNLAHALQSHDRTLSGGIASVAALGMITSAPAPGKRFSLGVGVGNYRGENAAALGFTGRVTDSFVVKFGVGFSNDDYTSAGGIIYSW